MNQAANGSGSGQVGTDTVVFWDDEGVEIVSVTSSDIPSDVLCDIFDTPEIREEIEQVSGRHVDTTSEESVVEDFKNLISGTRKE